MGLDMYLTKRAKGSAEHELVAYWRKANHIHGWFERNTTDGYIENCEYYPVCREQLCDLARDCRIARLNPNVRKMIFPLHEGFLFGSFDYADDYYRDCLDETIRMIEDIEANLKEGDELFYHTWW